MKRKTNKHTQAKRKLTGASRARSAAPKKQKTQKRQAAFSLDDIHVGASVYDYRSRKLIYGNRKFLDITGLSPEQCFGLPLEEFNRWIHPDDLALIVANVRPSILQVFQMYKQNRFRRMVYTVNFRLREKGGHYRMVLSQNTMTEIDGPENFPAQSLNIISDLDNYKEDHKIIITIKIFNERTGRWEIALKKELLHIPLMLTAKEKAILPLMLADRSAHDISVILKMNELTVRSHWRNILMKTNCGTQKELKSLAIVEGWI
jgi:DNA-binding CsgD family transcriptional regulator/PAS domain-containing protein